MNCVKLFRILMKFEGVYVAEGFTVGSYAFQKRCIVLLDLLL